MNRNIKILLIVLVIAVPVYYFVINKPWNTLKGELKDFSIKDTASITKVFLADKKGNQVLLQLNERGQWIVNNKYKADISKVNLLKSTMAQVKVRNPLAESEFNTVVAMMASNAIKAEFYQNDELIKAVYVGSQTPDNTGTFMMVEGSSTPFVTHIPGFVGYLSPRFNTEAIRWKTKEVFVTPADQIDLISVGYPQETEQSFVVDNTGATPVLKNTSGEKIEADPAFLKYYLGSFASLYFEGYVEDMKPIQNDSIKKSPVFCVMELKQKDGSITRLEIHRKGITRRSAVQINEEGERPEFDIDKYLAFLNDEKDVVYVQDYVFRNVLKKRSDFSPSRLP